eukprot:scaffold225244_cov31-Tisochrysis_lutea.AAC.1
MSTAFAVCHFCRRSPCCAAWRACRAGSDSISFMMRWDDVIACSSVRLGACELSMRRVAGAAVRIIELARRSSMSSGAADCR